MNGVSPSYKFPESVPPGKNGPMFSHSFIRRRAAVGLSSMLDFRQSREILTAIKYSAKCRMSRLEAR